MKCILQLCIYLTFVSFAGAQPTIRHFIPINTHIGGSLATLQSVSGQGISQRPGISVALNTGYMIRYKESIGLSLGGGVILNEYRFSATGVLSDQYYSVAYYAFNARSRLFILIPLKRNKQSVLSLSATAGCRFIGNDQLKGSAGILAAQSSVYRQLRPFLEPEIGLTKLMRHNQVDLALFYHIGLLASKPFQVNLSTPQASSVASSGLNYAGLVVRFNPELFRNKSFKPKEILPVTPLIAADTAYGKREDRSRYSFEVRRKKILLKIRDNSEIDGDTLSIYLNDEPVLIQYGLTAKSKKIRLSLREGVNKISLFAHNEGKVPPNTAECIIRSGFRNYRVNTASGLRYNEVITIRYSP